MVPIKTGFLSGERVVSGMSLGRKNIACTRALKEPRESNFVGFTQLPSCTVCARPPTSNDHNFLVRALFWVFLDSMESIWSLESDHLLFNGNWCSHTC